MTYSIPIVNIIIESMYQWPDINLIYSGNNVDTISVCVSTMSDNDCNLIFQPNDNVYCIMTRQWQYNIYYSIILCNILIWWLANLLLLWNICLLSVNDLLAIDLNVNGVMAYYSNILYNENINRPIYYDIRNDIDILNDSIREKSSYQ